MSSKTTDMRKAICNYCGSPNLRADRSLSGRIICMSCGRPYGGRSFSVNKTGKGVLSNSHLFLYLLLFMIVFIIIAANS